MLPSIKEGDICIDLGRCHYRWIYSYGDYYCFIKEYDHAELLQSNYKRIIHFGQRNTDLKHLFYCFPKEVGELIRRLAYEVYGESNWSNNDRKRRGLPAIRIKEYTKKRNSNRNNMIPVE